MNDGLMKLLFVWRFLLLFFVLNIQGCATKEVSSWSFGKPPGLNSDLRNQEIQLFGKTLFNDRRLSFNNAISCASCHQPNRAFTDGKNLATGINNSVAFRNTPSLLNCAYLPRLMADGEVKSLEVQVLVPLTDPREMGNSIQHVISKMRKIKSYNHAAKRLFGRAFDAYVLTRAIAAYERSLIGQTSRFDAFWKGRKEALNPDEKRGWQLFDEVLKCTQCHPAPRFTTYAVVNNGLKQFNSIDNGRFRITGNKTDLNCYKIPSLRNVARTAPFMHDGSLKTLEEVIDFYSRGGNQVANQSIFVHRFEISQKEKSQLIDFLKTLTDIGK